MTRRTYRARALPFLLAFGFAVAAQACGGARQEPPAPPALVFKGPAFFVDAAKVASGNPGYCFKLAGWQLARDAAGKPKRTKRGLLILEMR